MKLPTFQEEEKMTFYTCTEVTQKLFLRDIEGLYYTVNKKSPALNGTFSL
jgi:hypothetical protein